MVVVEAEGQLGSVLFALLPCHTTKTPNQQQQYMCYFDIRDSELIPDLHGSNSVVYDISRYIEKSRWKRQIR